MVGESDLALVHALQVRPRADWTELGSVLDCTPATAARRWQRLSGSGEAWVAAVPGPRCSAFTAYVGVRCAAGAREAVAAELVRDPAAVTVELTVGSHDLLVEVITGDLAEFGRFLMGRMEVLPGVTRCQVAVATSVVTEASQWRLDALDPGQSSALLRAGGGPASDRPAPRRLSALDRRLLVELGRDGRESWDGLARRAETSAATARRRAERLLASGEAALRCDVAAGLFERPVTAALWLRAPAGELGAVARALADAPSVRFVATVAGAQNLLVAVWLRSVDELSRLEAELALRFPVLAVEDRTVALRCAKRMGRVLDGDGRSVAVVPLGPWSEGEAQASRWGREELRG